MARNRATAGGITALGCGFDPQRMLSRQCAIRESHGRESHGEGKNELEIVEGDISVESIEKLVRVQQSHRYDLIVSARQVADSFVMDHAPNEMDAILIPTRGAPYEIMNSALLVRKAEEKDWNAYLVPNSVPPSRKRNVRSCQP